MVDKPVDPRFQDDEVTLTEVSKTLYRMINTTTTFALAISTATAHLMSVITHSNFPFIFLFIFRYLRLVVHIVSFWLYKPSPIPANPTVSAADCTIIIPTVEPENEDFHECLTSVLTNSPGAVLIVTVGRANLRATRRIIAPFRVSHPNVTFNVTATQIANKRRQVAHAIPQVLTPVTVLVDDHVFWPSVNFLRTIIAPFEDPQVGVVGTNKRVRRFNTGFGVRSFWNMIGALYLERHNFEIRATNAIDGGVFVISGRTSAHRTCILQDPAFIAGFTNERFFFGKFGPLNADDDNFITRWEVSHGWKIKIQYCKDAMIETTLGTYPKFLSQCLRWVRTTWRSNSASLFTDRTVWRTQPWCVYAVYITSFFNFALFCDSALFYTLLKTTFGNATTVKLLCAWIFASKMVKLLPYFIRNPIDLFYLPGYFAFAYWHSLIKLYALFTFHVTVWGGRNLDAVGGDDGSSSSSDDDHSSDPNSDSDPDGDEINLTRRIHRVNRSRRPTRVHFSDPINTPYGATTGANPHRRPANVLESQIPDPTAVPGKVVLRSRNGAAKTQQSPYKRSFTRGENCERLHSEGRDLLRQRCVLGWADYPERG